MSMQSIIVYSQSEIGRKRVQKKMNAKHLEFKDLESLENQIELNKSNICIFFYLESAEDIENLTYLKSKFKIREALLIPIVTSVTKRKVIELGCNPISIEEDHSDFNFLIHNMISNFKEWEHEVKEEVVFNLETYINTVKDKVNSPLAAVCLQSEYCLGDDNVCEDRKILHSFLMELSNVISKVTNINLRNLKKQDYSQKSKTYKL